MAQNRCLKPHRSNVALLRRIGELERELNASRAETGFLQGEVERRQGVERLRKLDYDTLTEEAQRVRETLDFMVLMSVSLTSPRAFWNSVRDGARLFGRDPERYTQQFLNAFMRESCMMAGASLSIVLEEEREANATRANE